ncbi:hypothetical protein CQW23_02539 [Capsicum baccatum]|uniref:Uncharacterized protein n=1 Tax=Capsicum baccatum TaxID=33114 RepID=A0A2G2XRP4_CAPBA|nr:hypothetical protein CQW23_02539 [Capsicum baccatum]
MENDSAAVATTTTKKTTTTWSTWEELLLAFAVKRHGLKNWESVAMELQSRISLPVLLTAQICKDKYHDLRRRFMNSYNNNSYDEKTNDSFDEGVELDVDGNGDVTIPWIEELRQLRVAELKKEVQRYDLSIQSLQLKVKTMEEERERSLKEKSLDDGKRPDLEDVKEERSQNDKNSGADVKPEDSTGKAVSSEESDRENRSFNESNSTENRETGAKNEPEPVEIGEDKPVQEVKPVSEADSYNDSSSDRQEKKVRRDSGDLRDTVSESKEETKENSDVQSTATLTKRKRQCSGGDGGRNGGDAAEMASPAVGIKGEVTAKSEPLIEFLDIIRSHKRGSMFKRRLDSQKADKYKSIIRQHMDLETVQARIDDGSYCSCPAKFYLDLLLVFNNAIVYFPKSSSESTAANELRSIVIEELRKTRTQSKDQSPGPRLAPLKIQLKPELEISDSLLAKHKSTVPIVVCRKRSSISAKAAGSGNNKPEKHGDSKPPLNPKPPIKSSSNEEESSIKLGMKEKPVTGARSMRRSSKGRSNNNASPSNNNNNQNTNPKQTNSGGDKKEDAKPEKKKEESKKRGAAADFLKRIKKTSPTKGTLIEALKNDPTEDVVSVKVSNKKEQQKKKVDERREVPVRRSGGGGGSAIKEEGSPSKRSVGRPPKRGGREVVVQEKRGRENSEKDDSSKRPKKRSRR